MALVLIEGFDHLSTAQMTAKGWSAGASSMQTGRFGGQCARIATSSTVAPSKALPATYATLFAGIAVRMATVPTGEDALSLRVGATKTVRLGISASKLQVRNSGGTVVATGTTVLLPNVWYYFEIKAFINGASGTCEVWLNGVQEIASTVGNFGSTNLDHVAFENFASAAVAYDYDDMYVLDNTGAAPRNTFLGDVRVSALMPTADGAHLQWTPSTGVTHFNLVNEIPANDDTNYVSDATPGDLDTYAFADVDTAATVFGVQRDVYARKDDAALRQIAPVVRQGGVDTVGPTATLSASYAFYSDILNQDPTGTDWTPTTVNADEFGIKEIA